MLITTRYTMATEAVINGKGDPTEESEIRNGVFSLVCKTFGIKSLKPYQKGSLVALSLKTVSHVSLLVVENRLRFKH